MDIFAYCKAVFRQRPVYLYIEVDDFTAVTDSSLGLGFNFDCLVSQQCIH
ncbi:MAG: hypothetical protein M3O09_02480 [Acidobacteriota bacterium]|nr:hypothetical protein [Acidobacteriota bacterium]